MKLNVQTDYSLRLLMFLATKEGGVATIQESSARMSISQTHLMRVAAKLVAKGLLSSTRGRKGGISLAKSASEITVEEVIRAMEPDFNLVECFDEANSKCTIQPGCLLAGVLASALDAFFAQLRGVTLAQLTVRNRAELVAIFRLDDLTWHERATQTQSSRGRSRVAK